MATKKAKSPSQPRAQITDRDMDLFEDLFASRIMSADHIRDLYFEGRTPASEKRLAALVKDEFLQHLPRFKNEPASIALTNRAFKELKAAGRLRHFQELSGRDFEWRDIGDRHQISQNRVRHELGVMDAKVAFAKALRGCPERTISEFWTWPALYDFEVRDTRPPGKRNPSGTRRVAPDAFLRLGNKETGGETYFYFEVDLKNESQPILQNKMLAYMEHHTTRGILDFLRFDKTDPNVSYGGFRVLFIIGRPRDPRKGNVQDDADVVVEERGRVNNVAHHCLAMRPPVKGLAWIASRADVLRDPLGPIWIRPKDYLEAVAGTPYDPARSDWKPRRREVARDKLVASKIVRQSLFQSKKNAPNDVGA